MSTARVATPFPPVVQSEQELESTLSEPGPELVRDMATLTGDLLILGVGGKMGPSLARLARRAMDAAGSKHKVVGVARFTSPRLHDELRDAGIETVPADLLDQPSVDKLPDAESVVFMAGMKFGSTGNAPLTWAMNAWVPAIVARRYRHSRIVIFSTGNVYPLTPVIRGGALETDSVGPVGDYAQSCLARERIFEHFSGQYGTRETILRLNYAVDLRYGVLVDIARKVHLSEPIDLSMGHVNVIWQGDANSIALRAFSAADCPPKILNVTGPETVSIRFLADRFGQLLGMKPSFLGRESETALLGNASLCHSLFGYPSVTLDLLIRWTAHWVQEDLPILNKPTHFEERQGRF